MNKYRKLKILLIKSVKLFNNDQKKKKRTTIIIIVQVEKDKKNVVSNNCTEVFCAREDINPSPEMYLKVRRKCNLVHQKLQTWTQKQKQGLLVF